MHAHEHKSVGQGGKLNVVCLRVNICKNNFVMGLMPTVHKYIMGMSPDEGNVNMFLIRLIMKKSGNGRTVVFWEAVSIRYHELYN